MGVCNCSQPRPGGCSACNPTPLPLGLPYTYPVPLGPVRAPVLCPVCHGKQRVKHDFYPVNPGESQLAGEWIPCRTCQGRGVV